MAGVKDMSKVILLEDPASKERKLVDKSNNHANIQAYDAVMKVRTEVDKLSHKVHPTCIILTDYLLYQMINKFGPILYPVNHHVFTHKRILAL